MEKAEKLIDKYSFLVIIVLTFLAFKALFIPGYYGASDDMHIAWLYEMDKIIKLGQFPPRFVPDLSYGFGYPLFNFIFPLPFYIAEIFHLLGFSLVGSIKLLFLLSIPISAYLMYKLLREFVSPILAITGAVVYSYTPYRATDIYIRGAIGEIVAFIFLPIIILSVIKVFQKNKKWIGIGALSLTVLITSHNIIAYMFVPFVILLTIVLLFLNRLKRPPLVDYFLLFFLGFLASSFFWLPAIIESRLMQYDTVFNFADHFPTIKQLITPYFGYGASVPGPGDGMSFDIGTVGLIIFIAAIIYAAFKWHKLSKLTKIVFVWGISVFLVSVFMMNFRSRFIWESLPLIKYFQFPWRFLTLTTLVIPIFIIVFNEFKYKSEISLIVLTLGIFLNFNKFKPQDYLERNDSYYLNRYIPAPEVSDEYKKQSEEYLRLPKDTEIRPDRIYPLADSSGNEIKNIEKQNDLDFIVSTVSDENFVINFNKYYFPGWRAYLDGEKVSISPGKPLGNITVNVPNGTHEVEVVFKESTFRKILNYVSLFSLLGIFTILCYGYFGKIIKNDGR